MTIKTFARVCATMLACLVGPWSAWAQLPPPSDEQKLADAYTAKSYSPYAGRGFPTNVYFGDTHLHTSFSMDAGAYGNTLGPEEAYRFARGEEVTSAMGIRAKLSRPLDFLAVADHSDNMGFFADLFAGAPHVLADPTGKNWYKRVKAGKGAGVAIELVQKFSQGELPKALM